MSITNVVCVVVGCFLISIAGGCATIVTPGPDQVSFTSEPPGASVLVDGVSAGQTPCIVQVARKAKNIEFQLAGYEGTTMSVQRHLNGWIFGNIVFGGLIGIIVDVATGNSMKADAAMTVTLRRSGAGAEGSFPDLLPYRQIASVWRTIAHNTMRTSPVAAGPPLGE